MRLDHIAIRTPDRAKTVEFLMKSLGYTIQKVDGEDTFPIYFNDEQTEFATCTALQPPERVGSLGWTVNFGGEYHLAPEYFVSEGTPDSIVGQWVAERGGAAIHHFAYQVDDVEAKMKEWTDNGIADFSSSEPFRCEDLVQVFSKYQPLTGVVYEFIQRKEFGFCRANILNLMRASKGD